MTVTREQLFHEVWAEPMITVAARHEVSGNYLARVCAHLNIPHPPRGYWAKLKVGNVPKQPSLPPARPGEVLEWSKGDGVPRVTPRKSAPGNGSVSKPQNAPVTDPPTRHQLVMAVREFFEAGRVSEVGYLRPLKRNLVDIFTSKATLPSALDTANALFLAFEKRGHRVALSSEQYVRRPELTVYEGQKFDYWHQEPWRPGRETLVHLGDVAFGLTVYEQTDYVEVTYSWDRAIRYVRVSEDPPKRRHGWTPSTTKQHMPCGRLALRAYSPYGRVEWQQIWAEKNVGELQKKGVDIAKELEVIAPTIVTRREEAKKQAEIEHQRWLAECHERERQERERRRAEAREASRKDLLDIVDAWALARNLENFFEDAERRAATLSLQEQTGIRERLSEARALLGGTDALARLARWKAPGNR